MAVLSGFMSLGVQRHSETRSEGQRLADTGSGPVGTQQGGIWEADTQKGRIWDAEIQQGRICGAQAPSEADLGTESL